MLRGEITLTLQEIDMLKRLSKTYTDLQSSPIIQKMLEWQPEENTRQYDAIVNIDEVETMIDTLQGLVMDKPEATENVEIEKLLEKLREYYHQKQEDAQPVLPAS